MGVGDREDFATPLPPKVIIRAKIRGNWANYEQKSKYCAPPPPPTFKNLHAIARHQRSSITSVIEIKWAKPAVENLIFDFPYGHFFSSLLIPIQID